MQIERTAQQPPSQANISFPKRNPFSTLGYATEKNTAEIERFMEGMHFPSMEEANKMLGAAEDNLDIRYQLMHCLLEAKLHNEAFDLVESHDDKNTHWLFSDALISFSTDCAFDFSNRQLREALQQNEFVAPLLLSEKALPAMMPDTVGEGTEEEAVEYALGAQMTSAAYR